MPEFAELLEGYRRFRAKGFIEERERFAELAEQGQHPKLMVISCSDSRVEPAQIFDVHPGDIFVVRNVAALVPPYETTPGLHGVSAAIEFAVEVLEVKQIVVMGHGLCGGCKAALAPPKPVSDGNQLNFVRDWIAPLAEMRGDVVAEHGVSGRRAEQAMELAAVRLSVANLQSFPFIRHRIAHTKLKLRGAFFAIPEGELLVMDAQSGAFTPAPLD